MPWMRSTVRTRPGTDESPPVPVNGAELDRMIAFVALAGTEPDQRRIDRFVRGFVRRFL